MFTSGCRIWSFGKEGGYLGGLGMVCRLIYVEDDSSRSLGSLVAACEAYRSTIRMMLVLQDPRGSLLLLHVVKLSPLCKNTAYVQLRSRIPEW